MSYFLGLTMEAKKEAHSFLKVKDFADMYGVSLSWVYKYVKTGEIPIVQMPGGALRIDYAAYKARYESGQQNRSLKISISNSPSRYHTRGDDTWLD